MLMLLSQLLLLKLLLLLVLLLVLWCKSCCTMNNLILATFKGFCEITQCSTMLMCTFYIKLES